LRSADRREDRLCRGLFFTGTDTGVGKTQVTAAVARILRSLGRQVGVCKPVATGAEPGAGGLCSNDTRILAEAAGIDRDLERVTPWSFPEPVAPSVAARHHGVRLSIEDMAAAVRKWHRPDNVVLVEGVGGLMCPLTDTETVADLAEELALPLIVVARRSLGTLSHTLLTLEVAAARGLKVAGVVVNETEPPEGLAAASNVDELRRRMPAPLLAAAPYQLAASFDLAPALVHVDWWTLAGRECKAHAQPAVSSKSGEQGEQLGQWRP
jgi:dethiobiotin synthetase